MKNKLLIHSCCAPCFIGVIYKLIEEYSVTVLFYNPNIEPVDEYIKRKETQMNLLNKLNINYIDVDYNNDEFKNKIIGYEQEPEKGFRCSLCFELRLEKTAGIAKEQGYEYFGTTLSVSPHKDSKLINELGVSISTKYKIKYLVSDFKEDNGFQKSIELAKEHKLYRQNYCGCKYSRRVK